MVDGDNLWAIAAEHLPLIFNRFFKTGASRKGATQGSGLGLYIVKSLCEQCGYRFSVRSTLQRGSCFAIFIPQPPSAPA